MTFIHELLRAVTFVSVILIAYGVLFLMWVFCQRLLENTPAVILLSILGSFSFFFMVKTAFFLCARLKTLVY